MNLRLPLMIGILNLILLGTGLRPLSAQQIVAIQPKLKHISETVFGSSRKDEAREQSSTFKNHGARIWKRQSDWSIISSKTYAQFDLRNENSDFPQIYSLQILLNKYQVTPLSQPILLRSRSLFFFHPCFRTNHHCLNNGVVELEYIAGLRMASNAEVEKMVEFKVDKRLFGIVGWIGKVGLKFHLHRLTAKQKGP